MPSQIFTARTAARKFGAMLDAAQSGPVTIYRHGRPQAAMVSWKLFQDYRKAYEEVLDDRHLDYLEKSLEALAAGRLGTGQRALALSKRFRTEGVAAQHGAHTEKKEGA